MFTPSLSCLRSTAARSARFPSLRRRLQHLRHTNRVAEDELQERRRLRKLLRDTMKRANTADSPGERGSRSDDSVAAIRLLPRNNALEAAMALSISENRDARTELELVRRLINSTLLSLASPVDRRWDPYDVKPQVFALNTYIALPVFTSIHYLRLFCQRFGFAVRDPSGVLWAAGASSTAEDVSAAGLLSDGVVQSEWWHHRHAPPVHTTEVTMDESDRSSAAQHSHVNRDGDSSDAPPSATGVPGAHGCEGKEAAAATRADASQSPGESVVPSSTDQGGSSASPMVEGPSESLIDASSLFDAMMMEGIADDGAAAASAKGSSKKKRANMRGTPKPLSRAGATQRPPAGGKRAGFKKRRQTRRCRLAKRGRRQASCKASASSTQSAASGEGTNAQKQRAKSEDAAKSAYWQSVAQTSPFGFKQATPLPTYGPFLYPFLLGYFADISTLLHNASIVPEKVDIVVNPGSPIEFVLARAATDRILHKEQILHIAYLKVERELQREFSEFFSLYCPEVLYASSACVPLPMDRGELERVHRASRTAVNGPPGASGASSNPLQEYRERTRVLREAAYRNGVAYELTILIQSTSLEETFMKMQHAKHRSMLMGHADLDIMPEAAAAPHVREMAQRFYDGTSEQEKRATQKTIALHAAEKPNAHGGGDGERFGFPESNARHSPPGAPRMGAFVCRGIPCTINVAQSADSYYHDPTNAYTEAHAVFTEELRVKRGQ
ncbi:hypothetical protein ABL78_1097 [Leptomonas seymouri]|uniref:Uncharacterized protein n=1 Tax=Leptomonas seymouri TaxID=5684 RepID=A0A0N1I7Y8_LEPSE|nr:hypothetical protein ABL78_1097 [Leptomonas seymouri]|eukprot:KPI89834.1 hypothetical protein ABL78_1097 [Leptomonas seymouri]